jgi:hypothetical protein
MKIDGFGNRLNRHLSDSSKQFGTRVTSNSYRKTVGIASEDKNIDSGFNIDEGS